MRKTVCYLRIALILGYAVWPLITLISDFCFGIRAEAVFPVPFCIAGGLAFLLTAVLSFLVPRWSDEGFTKADAVFSAVLLFECILGCIRFYSKPGMLFACFAILASFIMLWRTGSSVRGRVVVTIVSVPLLLIFLLGMTVNFDAFDDEVISSAPSPDGTKTLSVIDRHGEFGRSWVEVRVFEPGLIRHVGPIRFLPENYGRIIWDEGRMDLESEGGAIEYPSVQWQGNDTALINGEPTNID